MRHKDCIFVREDDCPKEELRISCEVCEKHKYTEEIKRAVADYESLGEAFRAVFTTMNTLIKNDGGKVEVEVPVDSAHILNRVAVALLA